MGYLEDKLAQAKALVGKRVEIPVHYDAWMQGARCGVVTSVGKDGTCVYVAPDIKPVWRVKIWRLDFEYIKVL
jgi:hypothetical protein